LAGCILAAVPAAAEDWPQFRGVNRDSAAPAELGAVDFPAQGLPVVWRTPVGYGFSSPLIAAGRVYLADAELRKPQASERLHCYDGATGRELWVHSQSVAYPDWAFAPDQKSGPNATGLVHDGKAYSYGMLGDLWCLDAASGAELWHRNFMTDYGLKPFTGTTSSPLIEGRLLILCIGGPGGAGVVALEKDTGREVWRALDDPPTYSSPLVIDAGGRRQLIVWTPAAVTSLDPASGRTWWRQEVNTASDYGVATPVCRGDLLLISGLMFQLSPAEPSAQVLWPSLKPMSARIFSQTSTPIILGGHVYAGRSNGKLACLDARTGRLIWEQGGITSKSQGATIHLTPVGESVLLVTDEGNLIRARLDPSGYQELGRTHVIDPDYRFAGRLLIWSPPAFANGHLYLRNTSELICRRLVQK
jgi:outer membrane protein assembly factor BamB